MAQINWGLLNNQPDFAATYLNALEVGQDRRRIADRRNALEIASTDPLGAEERLMAAGDFQTAAVLAKRREAGEAQQVRAGLQPQIEAGQYGQAATAALGAGQDDLAKQLAQMDETQREQAKERADLLGRFGYSLKPLPYEQRKARILEAAPMLQQSGITPEMIQNFDPTDGAIDAVVTRALTLKEQIDAAKPLVIPGVGLGWAPGTGPGGAAPAAPAPARPSGLVEPGNIDLHSRPTVKNADGTISTVRSMSVEMGGREYLIPTVSDDGRIMSDTEAVQTFQRTGRHLGVFDSPAAADGYAKTLHDQQAVEYGAGQAEISGGAGGDTLQPQGVDDFLGGVGRVTSGFRSPEKNRAVGGVPTSLHMKDRARDIVPKGGETMEQLAARLKASGRFTKVLNEGDHVHVEYDDPSAAQMAGNAGSDVIAGSGGTDQMTDAGNGWRIQRMPNPALERQTARDAVADQNTARDDARADRADRRAEESLQLQRQAAERSANPPIPAETRAKYAAQANTANAALEAVNNIQDQLGRTRQLGPGGRYATNPNEFAQLEVYVRDLQIKMKEAYNLGALTGPDMAFIDAIAADPRSLQSAVMKNTFVPRLRAISKTLGQQHRRVKAEFRAIGGDPKSIPPLYLSPRSQYRQDQNGRVVPKQAQQQQPQGARPQGGRREARKMSDAELKAALGL